MNTNLTRLAARRAHLIERAASQRLTLARQVEPWRLVLERADHSLVVLRYLKTHPLWLAAAGGTLLYVLGPGRIWRWIGRGMLAWRMAARLRFGR